jgi:hypothetical protein
MTSRELVLKTLRFEEVPRLPRYLWALPYITMYRKEDYDKFLALFPLDITMESGFNYGPSRYSGGVYGKKGSYTDSFGCEREMLEDGVAGEVKNPLIKSSDDLDRYRLPWEILDDAEYAGQLDYYNSTNLFVCGGTMVAPFERMQFLRGTEPLFIDIATESPLFFRLRDMIHDFNVRDIKLMSAQALDAVLFVDDWGSQQSLLISPASWRRFFKPLYKEYCDIIHKSGKYVFYHCDGHIEAIFDDLIEIGVDALNAQLFIMDMEALGKKYAGKITFWGDLDRQTTLSFGTEDEVRASVRRLKKAVMPQKKTGLIAHTEWETTIPFRNMVAAYEEFDK